MARAAPLRQLWRERVPEPIRYGLGRVLAPVAVEYTLRAARRSKGRAGSGPLTLVGFFSGASGIAVSAQLASQALNLLGIPHRCVDIRDVANPPDPGDGASGGWLFFLNPPELLWLLYRWGPERLTGPRYGYWAWELPKAPPSWIRAAHAMDGVMAPSRFTAAAFAEMKVAVSVVPLPVPVSSLQILRPDAPTVGEFRVVTLFDFKSSMARKNPLGAIEAFKAAFGDEPTARLVIKTHNAHFAPISAKALAAKATGNIEVIDAVWSSDQVKDFIAGADALISLHRAEGFGLTLAEAMALGTPVVATGWSGNLDFMDETYACLVPYTIVPVNDAQHLYRGQIWAEPDVSTAATLLRRLKDDPAFAHDLAERARTHISRALSARAWIEALPAALRQILMDGTGK